MWIRQPVRSVSSGLAALALALSGASLIVEGGFGAGSNAGAASPRQLQVDPAVVDFPDTLLGTQTENSAILENDGSSTEGIDLLYGAVTFSGPGADDYQVLSGSNCPHPQEVGGDPTADIILMPGQSCALEIYFTPGGLGDRSATMMIQGSEDAVTLHGYGSIGYYQVDQQGTVAPMGDAAYFGDASGSPLYQPIVAMAQTGDNGGYWLVASDGGIFAFGNAGFFGSTGGQPLNSPIVGMAATPDEAATGWSPPTVASSPSVTPASTARPAALLLNQPIVGMAATPDGRRLLVGRLRRWHLRLRRRRLLRLDGSIHLNKPVVGMAATPDGGATGSSPLTGASSPSVTPGSTARQGLSS